MADTYSSILRNLRLSPRKARLVVDLVRGKKIARALDILRVTKKKGAPIVSKMIQSAMAAATDRATVDVDRLVISEVKVDKGPSLKRWMPRAQGRATPILKRMSHITVKLTEK